MITPPSAHSALIRNLEKKVTDKYNIVQNSQKIYFGYFGYNDYSWKDWI